MDLNGVRWRKSSHSSSNEGNCVEVARLADGRVAIRDSKRPEQSPIVVGVGDFAAFIHALKARRL